MRRPFTTKQANEQGISNQALRWGVHTGRWQRLDQGVYLRGGDPPNVVERALGCVVATGGVASGTLAGIMYELDSVYLREPFLTLPGKAESARTAVKNRDLTGDEVVMVHGYRCTNGLETMRDLAAVLDDIKWEQALESALRKKLVTIVELENALKERRRGNARIRRVLKLRPLGAPPTGSVMETMAVQLFRKDPTIPVPERQVEVRNKYDEFAGYVDLAMPDIGLFFELDGSGHKAQPRYDANRQTRVVAATAWLVGRYEWRDITETPISTLRSVRDLCELARSRSATLR